MNEVEYDAERTQELLERRGFTRRDLVKLGAFLPLSLSRRRSRHPL